MQLRKKNNYQSTSGNNESAPKAVLVTKINVVPKRMLFLRPIFEIVIECTGVNIAPAI